MFVVKQFSKVLKEKRTGVHMNSITGKNVQILYVRLEPGIETRHSHLNEQMGYILSGEIELTINGEAKICKSGDAYYIPGNMEHGFKILNNNTAEYIEIFSPVKEDNL